MNKKDPPKYVRPEDYPEHFDIVSFDNSKDEIKRKSLEKRVRAKHVSIIRKARDDPNVFAEYAFIDPDGKSFKQAEIHKDFQRKALDDNYNFLIYKFPRDHGKCPCGTTLLVSENGEYIKIKNWKGGYLLAVDCRTMKIVRAYSSPSQPNGLRRCITIKTESGRELTTTRNHPYLKDLEWVEADELEVGDRIGIMNGCSIPVEGNMTALEGYAAGVIVGDGCVTKSAGFSNPEDHIISLMTSFCDKNNWNIKLIKNTKCAYGISKTIMCGDYGPRDWLRDLDLLGRGEYEKHVPVQVLTGGHSARLGFLHGYFDTDGTVNPLRGGSFEYNSVNKDLLITIQDMLARIGVVSVLVRKNGIYKGTRHKSWRLMIRGQYMDVFFRKVLRIGRKYNEAKEVVEKYEVGNECGGKLDLIPEVVWRPFVKNSYSYLKKRGIRIDGSKNLTRTKLRKLAIADDYNIDLFTMLDSHIFWDKIVEIVDAGQKETYSIEVKEHHNFVAHGFITHNTSQMIIHTIWELGNDPNLRIKLVCESSNRARERLQTISQHIEKNPKVRNVFPHLKPAKKGDWTKSKIMIERLLISPDASIEATGIQTAVTGGRADRIKADDPVGRRNALELPKLRKTIKIAWKSDWLNLLEPGGRVVYIATPWHKDDLTHDIERNPEYQVLSQSVDNDYNSPWPEKWTREALQQKKRQIGTEEYDRGFRLKALSGDVVVVRKEWIKYWTIKPNYDNLIKFTAYDLSTGEGDDYFAWVTIGLNLETGRIYVLEAHNSRYTFLDQVEAVKRGARIWSPEFIGIETVQYQAALPQFLTDRRSGLIMPNIVQMKTKNLPKRIRLTTVTPLIEEPDRVLFNPAMNPDKNIELREEENLVDQLCDFPLCAHDDLVDALIYSLQLAIDYCLGKEIDNAKEEEEKEYDIEEESEEQEEDYEEDDEISNIRKYFSGH